MQIVWGDQISQETQGLDILGVRGLDQSLEASLVNGITTISIRARYFTILPWLLGEFFFEQKRSGATMFDPKLLQDFIARAEYLVLACTSLDESDGDMSGILGSQTFAKQINALRAGEQIAFPSDRTGAMLGVYLGPCRALGILADGPPGSVPPILLPPRGQQIWRARTASIGDTSALLSVLQAGTHLNSNLVREFVPHLSLKGLALNSEEATLLRAALTEDWTDSGSSEQYRRFVGTLDFLRLESERVPLQAERLLAEKYRQAVEVVVNDGVLLAWAEYEWRARLHFALETMFSAVCKTLADLGDANLSEIVATWKRDSELPSALTTSWPGASAAWEHTGKQAQSTVPKDLFLGELLPVGSIGSLSPHARALFAFAIVASLAEQSTVLREKGHFANRHSAGESALQLMDCDISEPFDQTLTKLAKICVDAHLATTYRKMAGGQKCSLRFFEDGARFIPTGLTAQAGRSGIRLHNVIGILAEAGVEGVRRAA